MATISLAKKRNLEDKVCQGDIYENVRYNYIDNEDDKTVDVVDFTFPYAIIISQACDVIAMDDFITMRQGKPTKYMPSILLCPIFEEETIKKGEHISDVFGAFSVTNLGDGPFGKGDMDVAKRDWHYRFHRLEVIVDNKSIFENYIVDFKQYFTVPMSYLVRNKSFRVCKLDELYAEQITLKFATYLTRVAIPEKSRGNTN